MSKSTPDNVRFLREAMTKSSSGEANALKDAAKWYYELLDLSVDSSISPDNHIAIIMRALAYSRCDEFARVVHQMTGWPIVHAAWPDMKQGFGHHALIKSPDGRLLDATGWTTPGILAKHRGVRAKKIQFHEIDPNITMSIGISDEDSLKRIAAVIRALPYPPYSDESFRAMSNADIFWEANDNPPPTP